MVDWLRRRSRPKPAEGGPVEDGVAVADEIAVPVGDQLPEEPEPGPEADAGPDEDPETEADADGEPEGVACPSCAFWIEPAPRSSRLCPRCRERIVVRQDGGPHGLLHGGRRQGVRGRTPARARRAALDGGAARVASAGEDRGGTAGPATAPRGAAPVRRGRGGVEGPVPLVGRPRRAGGPPGQALDGGRAAAPRAGRRAVRRGGLARAAAGRHRRPPQGSVGRPAARASPSPAPTPS